MRWTHVNRAENRNIYHVGWSRILFTEEDIQTAIDWTLGREGIFVVSTGDVGLLPTILRAAARRGEMPDDEFMNAFGEDVGLASIFGL